jgi:hypothetical protein
MQTLINYQSCNFFYTCGKKSISFYTYYKRSIGEKKGLQNCREVNLHVTYETLYTRSQK